LCDPKDDDDATELTPSSVRRARSERRHPTAPTSLTIKPSLLNPLENNARIEGKVAHTAEYGEGMFDAVIAVNVKGVFLGLRHVLPVMLKQKRVRSSTSPRSRGSWRPPECPPMSPQSMR
jgi:NAD(P)-dependent dehydrogenase (short-subunit alcohol dehydrogenase family)